MNVYVMEVSRVSDGVDRDVDGCYAAGGQYGVGRWSVALRKNGECVTYVDWGGGGY